MRSFWPKLAVGDGTWQNPPLERQNERKSMQNEEEIPKTMTPKQVPVTADNSIPAESDMYFAMFLKRSGVGKFYHHREPPIDAGGVRPNRDTLYSEAVFDLDAGLVTIMMPDPLAAASSLRDIRPIRHMCCCQERCSVSEFDLFIGDMTSLDVPGRHVERGPSSGLFEVFEICASFRGRRGPEVPAVVR